MSHCELFCFCRVLPEKRKQSCQSLKQVELLLKRWGRNLSPSPQIIHGLVGRKHFLQRPVPMVATTTSLRTFGPNDLTRFYSVGIRRVFGDISHRTQALRSSVRCSNPLILNMRTAEPF
ncbi:hypothetical protein TNCV_3577921 [Trichonephila clavipes]|uniref:Uncharacterized protein n=1 Tax=Trichonephila clavipes TaxID=2585209 RepID=A0A8X6RML0_TRICX|nr:hypothetical protein TNCV_3577921 [Trichonephila clavipes]